jgi:hypothetical protein
MWPRMLAQDSAKAHRPEDGINVSLHELVSAQMELIDYH